MMKLICNRSEIINICVKKEFITYLIRRIYIIMMSNIHYVFQLVYYLISIRKYNNKIQLIIKFRLNNKNKKVKNKQLNLLKNKKLIKNRLLKKLNKIYIQKKKLKMANTY